MPQTPGFVKQMQGKTGLGSLSITPSIPQGPVPEDLHSGSAEVRQNLLSSHTLCRRSGASHGCRVDCDDEVIFAFKPFIFHISYPLDSADRRSFLGRVAA